MEQLKKILITILFILYLFIPNNINAQGVIIDPSDSKRFALKGKISGVENVTVRLLQANRELRKIPYIGFRMSWNFDDLLIEISKRGYVTQKITINNIVPENYDKKLAGVFDIGAVQLYKKIEGLDIDFYNDPIAHIEFSKEDNAFHFSYDNRNNLSKTIEDFNKREADYLEALKSARSFLQDKKYNNSLIEYKRASGLKPNENFPKEKIKELNKLIEEEKAKNKKPGTKDKKEIEIKEPTTHEEESTEEISAEEFSGETIDDDFKKLNKLKNENKPAETSQILESIGNKYYLQDKLNEALKYYDQSLIIKKEMNDKKGTSNVLNNIAKVEMDSGMYEYAIEDYTESLMILKNINDKPAMVSVLKNLGSIYESTYRYSNALKSYSEALDISENIVDKAQTANILNSLGNASFKNGKYNEAIRYYNQSLEIDKSIGKDEVVSNTLNNIGIVYYNQGKFKEAVKTYNKSMDIARKSGNDIELSVSLNNIGNINYNWQEYAKALGFYEKSLKIKEEQNYEKGIALSLHNIGNVHKELKEYSKAIEYYKKSNEIGTNINFRELISKNYLSFSTVYTKIDDFERALAYYEKYANLEFSFTENDKMDQMNEVLVRFDLEKSKTEKEITELKGEILRQKLLSKIESDRNAKALKIRDLEILQKNQQVKTQRNLIIFFLTGFIILFILVLMLFRLIRQKISANRMLAQQKDQISTQKQEITDSIKYAERIQFALLPDENIFKKLEDYFVFFKPKDIVSGDFYWTAEKDNKLIIAAVDCTGHGVPGAFMSMLGITYLNEIVSNEKNVSASNILNKLREMIISSLHQSIEKEGARDGMDLALCVVDKKLMEIEYAGAFNPLYLVRNKELTLYKADKMPIGIHALYKPKSFTSNKIQVQKDDCLYIFSDGYMDQFGGTNAKKFMSRRFKQLLLDNSDKNMSTQKEILEETFNNWKLDSNQIDDVLIIGMKM